MQAALPSRHVLAVMHSPGIAGAFLPPELCKDSHLKEFGRHGIQRGPNGEEGAIHSSVPKQIAELIRLSGLALNRHHTDSIARYRAEQN